MKEAIIRNIPLFSTLPDNEITYLAGNLQQVKVPAGTMIFREGDYGDYLLVVLSGELEIVKELGTPEERLVAIRKEGEHIGEMSLISPAGTRSASVRSHTDSVILKMTRDDFGALLHRQPALAYEMILTLSDRLDQAHNHAIEDLQEINRQLVVAYEELKAAQQQIIEKEKLEKELEVARQIQTSILPDETPHIPGFGFSAVMIPTRAVGGDLFDFVHVDDKHVGLAIADVTDKGVPAAIFMALTRSLLRAEGLRSTDPGQVLQNINRVLIEMNTQNMFVTMLYGVLDLETRQFHYARAGHPGPMIVREKQALIEPTNQLGQALAIFPLMVLDVQMIQLQSGDTLLLYTDGVPDAVDAESHEFGMDRLRESILDACRTHAQPVCNDLIRAIDNFRNSAPQNDDITMVLLNVS